MNSQRSIRQINQLLAHVIPGLPDLHLGPVRIEINFHLLRTSRKDHQIGCHTHPWWDISMVQDGAITYETAEKAITPDHSDIVIFPPGVEHSWKTRTAPLVLESYMLGFFPVDSRGERILTRICDRCQTSSYRFALSSMLQQYRKNLWDAANERPALPLQPHRMGQLMQVFIVQLIADFFGDFFAEEDKRFQEEIGKSSANLKLAYRMEEFLRTHLSERITMRDMECQFGYSHRHLSRIFKEHTGKTIPNFLLTKRIHTACDLLLNEGSRTKEVAHAVGFTDVSYFCRIFREHTKLTPRQYREKLGK